MVTKPAPEASQLKLKLAEDLKQAMRGRDTVRISVIRLLLSAIRNAEIARLAEATDGDVLGAVAREIKQRRESIEAFKQGSRPDLVAKEEAELAILQAYLPPQMTREEMIATARRVIAEVGARGAADKGKVMSRLMAEVKGKADGREINALVTELLSQ